MTLPASWRRRRVNALQDAYLGDLEEESPLKVNTPEELFHTIKKDFRTKAPRASLPNHWRAKAQGSKATSSHPAQSEARVVPDADSEDGDWIDPDDPDRRLLEQWQLQNRVLVEEYNPSTSTLRLAALTHRR
jgi:hypothetical protein